MYTSDRSHTTVTSMILITALLAVSTAHVYMNGSVYSEEGETETRNAIMHQTYEGSFITSDGTVLTKADQPYVSGKITESEAESFAWIIGTPVTSGLRNTMRTYLYDGDESNDHGNDVYLTANRTLQNFAYNTVLNGREGSVIVLENKTGRILALASHSDESLPAFNLNNPEEFMDVCDSVNESLYIRGIYETDAPGSTFKMITAAAALRQLEKKKLDESDFEYYDNGWLETPDGAHVITNYDGVPNDDTDLAEAFCVSCNTYFANLALKTGWNALSETAESFLIGKDIEIPFLTTLHSTFLNEEKTPALLAMSGIGQGNITITPLHLALIGSAVANKGAAYQPCIVEEIRTPENKIIYKAKKQKVIDHALSKKSAKKLLAALHESAEWYGFDEETFGTVYAKTGTAETPSGTHTYMVAFTDLYSFCISINHGFYSSDLYDGAGQLLTLCNHMFSESGEK